MSSASRARLLMVDDEPDLLRSITFRLEMEGFEVITEPNGRLGHDRAISELPDAILLDVMMPGIDGISLCRVLKERADTASIPILMLTARSMMGDVEKAFAAGADDYVSKPFEWNELLGKLNRALAGRAAGT